MHITKWKKPLWKGYVLHDSNYMTFWKRQNYTDSKKISGCQRLKGIEGDGWVPGAQGIFRARYLDICSDNCYGGYKTVLICQNP